MLANVIAFFAAIAICTMVAIAGGGQPHPVVIFVVMILTFGIANAINKASRHSAKGKEQSPVISIRPIDAAEEVLTGSIDVPPTRHAAESSTKALSQPFGARAAGELRDGKLMITREAVLEVVRKPDEFDNVVAFAKPPGSPANLQPQAWFMALSPDSAIFFNDDASEIWSVVPQGISIPEAASGITIPRWGWPSITSVDGRKQTVPIDPFNVSVLKAWKAQSFDDYATCPQPWPNGWGLLAYGLMTGKMVSTFMRWQPKYTTLLEGINSLANNPSEMRSVLEIACRWYAGDAMIKTAQRLNISETHPVIREIRNAKKAALKRQLIILAIVVAVGIAIVTAVNIRAGAW